MQIIIESKQRTASSFNMLLRCNSLIVKHSCLIIKYQNRCKICIRINLKRVYFWDKVSCSYADLNLISRYECPWNSGTSNSVSLMLEVFVNFKTLSIYDWNKALIRVKEWKTVIWFIQNVKLIFQLMYAL